MRWQAGVYMLMELGFQEALVRGHPVDEGLWQVVTRSSNVLEWQWPISDDSTCQVSVPIEKRPPDSLIYDILNFDLAEPQCH